MMNFEERLESNSKGVATVRCTEIKVSTVIRMLHDGQTVEDILTQNPELTHKDISACLEYATELVSISDFESSTRRIIKESIERKALADTFRKKFKNHPITFKDSDGNQIIPFPDSE